MVELLRSNSPVLMSFATTLLAEAGIEHTVADLHMSTIDGSIAALQRRLLVARSQYDDARRLLTEAGVAVGAC